MAIWAIICTSFPFVGASVETLNKEDCRCLLPSESCWPSTATWDAFNTSVPGRLSVPLSPVDPCLNGGDKNDPDACQEALVWLGKDPFWLQTLPGGTESTGIFYLTALATYQCINTIVLQECCQTRFNFCLIFRTSQCMGSFAQCICGGSLE